MTNKFYIISFICLLISAVSCSNDSSSSESSPGSSTALEEYNPTGPKGWELNNTNTGIAAAGLVESDLTAFDLSGADAGKGEWVSGSGSILYLYKDQVIENRIITFTGYLKAPEGGTVIRNCIIRPTACNDGMSMVNLTGATIENCEIDGSLLGTDVMHAGISATNSIIRNCLIHECDCGVMANNSDGLTIIENNYIYNIKFKTGSDDHLAGSSIWSSTGGGIGFFNNRIVINDPAAKGHTSAAFFSQSLHGNIANVRVEGNLLISPAYVTRVTESTYTTYMPFSFVNNRLEVFDGIDGIYGFGYFKDDVNITIKPTWSENYVYDSGAADAKGAPISAASVEL